MERAWLDPRAQLHKNGAEPARPRRKRAQGTFVQTQRAQCTFSPARITRATVNLEIAAFGAALSPVACTTFYFAELAEGMGFEPTIRLLTV
jgi:hypothetical protein